MHTFKESSFSLYDKILKIASFAIAGSVIFALDKFETVELEEEIESTLMEEVYPFKED